jgi:lipoprotein-anchoring transpeptidase ErfK/SrfK
MRRIYISALLVSAFYGSACYGSAFADPLQINPDAYAASQRWNDQQQPPQQQTADAAQSNLGGGFLEFLFHGAQPQAPRAYQQPSGYQPAPSYYQPAPQSNVMNDPAPGYAPSADGDMAQHQPIDPKFERQTVAYGSREAPGTIIIDTPNKFLYLVEADGRAMRYGIGVGKPGFIWSGEKTISAKREWPDWRPPDEMIARRPDLPRFMAGGPDNPLGARAMYLGSTLYRIHGSNEPWTIGTNVSSGCIRMRNQDVIDLYDRVKVGTKVVVI